MTRQAGTRSTVSHPAENQLRGGGTGGTRFGKTERSNILASCDSCLGAPRAVITWAQRAIVNTTPGGGGGGGFGAAEALADPVATFSEPHILSQWGLP